MKMIGKSYSGFCSRYVSEENLYTYNVTLLNEGRNRLKFLMRHGSSMFASKE